MHGICSNYCGRRPATKSDELVQSHLSSGETDNSAEDAIIEGKQSRSLNNNDPVIFCQRRLKAADINIMLNAGSCQPTTDYSFPVVSSRSGPTVFLALLLVDHVGQSCGQAPVSVTGIMLLVMSSAMSARQSIVQLKFRSTNGEVGEQSVKWQLKTVMH